MVRAVRRGYTTRRDAARVSAKTTSAASIPSRSRGPSCRGAVPGAQFAERAWTRSAAALIARSSQWSYSSTRQSTGRPRILATSKGILVCGKTAGTHAAAWW